MSRIPFLYPSLNGFENRIVYYESSRGCPFSCSYCLSSIDKSVRFRDLKLVLVMDLLQLPLSLVFTRFMNLFSALLPTPSDNMPSRLLVLAAGIILTGIGAAMSLNMRIIPNPGDGIVQAISDCIGKSVGFTKNCFDLFNICLTTSIGLLFAHKLIGIGLGTVIAVLGVGRVIAVFNRLFMKKMTAAAGVEY